MHGRGRFAQCNSATFMGAPVKVISCCDMFLVLSPVQKQKFAITMYKICHKKNVCCFHSINENGWHFVCNTSDLKLYSLSKKSTLKIWDFWRIFEFVMNYMQINIGSSHLQFHKKLTNVFLLSFFRVRGCFPWDVRGKFTWVIHKRWV